MTLTRLTLTTLRCLGALAVAAVAPTIGERGFTLALRAVLR